MYKCLPFVYSGDLSVLKNIHFLLFSTWNVFCFQYIIYIVFILNVNKMSKRSDFSNWWLYYVLDFFFRRLEYQNRNDDTRWRKYLDFLLLLPYSTNICNSKFQYGYILFYSHQRLQLGALKPCSSVLWRHKVRPWG